MIARRVALALVGALALLPACRPPKYKQFASRDGDFKTLVPWGWFVMAESDGQNYSNTTFFGPFEPSFYLGVPSFSVRWHGNYKPHRLRDGSLEMYSGPKNYVEQTLAQVYGAQRVMEKEATEVELGRLKATHFVVLSPVPVPDYRLWGVERKRSGKEKINMRRHAYVVVPAKNGFYVLVYPATREGYPRYEKQFNQLVNFFEIIKDGPGGEPFEPGSG